MTGAPIGTANLVTAVRAVLVAAIAAAGLVDADAAGWPATVVVVGTVAALLDLRGRLAGAAHRHGEPRSARASTWRSTPRSSWCSRGWSGGSA